MDDLTLLFNSCMSASQPERSSAEHRLEALKTQENFPVQLLQYIASSNPLPINQFAAVTLKNHVQQCWAPNEGHSITPLVKQTLKDSLYQKMLSTDNSVASLLRESIVAIAAHDFPSLWPGVLEHLQSGLSAGYRQNPKVVYETLLTAHKLFKRYRYSFRSDELWTEINSVVAGLFAPFFNISLEFGTCLQSAGSAQELDTHLHTLIPFLKIFVSLNGQDIPQQFEDTLKDWMTLFNYLMTYKSPLLQDDALLLMMKAKVLKALNLYAQKYDEDFEPYIEAFCNIVWGMLSETAGRSEYDRFVSAALEFFKVVTFKPTISQLLQKNLNVFFTSLILPNMVISEDEEDLAVQAPMEFVKMFLEDANEDTRRCACAQLMKALLKQFPQDINALVAAHQSAVLSECSADPVGSWKRMDAFILLVSGVFPVMYTARTGATAIATSDQYICELYTNLIAQQLQSSSSIIVKTSCLKYIYVYRNQFPKNALLQLLGQISQFIENDSDLLVSYATAVLERILMIKQQDRVLLFTRDSFSPYINALLQSLANALVKHPRNSYAMKAFFRVMWLAQEDFSQFSVPACGIFIEHLKEVLVNPKDSDPLFNWYMFECVALLIKSASAQDLPVVQSKLEPYMALIIQKSNADLLPYAFQVQALLIRRQGALSETNSQLLTSVLPLGNWETGSRYYAPALVIFLENTIRTLPECLASKINEVAGIVYQLFVLALDGQAFSLLTTCIEAYSLDALSTVLRDLYIMMFTKMHNAKNKKIRLGPLFHKGFALFSCTFALKHGAKSLEHSMNSVQPEIFPMVVKGELAQNLRAVDTAIERKLVSVAITELLAQPLPQEIWCELFLSTLKMLEIQTNITSGTQYSSGLTDLPEENSIQMSKDSYQKVYSAEGPLVDKLSHINDAKQHLLQTVASYPFPQGLGNYLAPFLDEASKQLLPI